MFIAMNRFRVKKGAEGAFEKVWMSRVRIWIAFPGVLRNSVPIHV